MRLLSPTLWTVCLTVWLAASPVRAAWHAESVTPQATASPALRHEAVSLRNGDEGRPLEAHLVTLDRARCTLRVVDLAPGQSVAEGAAAVRALAAVNGGYFRADRSPLGLVIAQGTTVHPWETSKILTGVLAVPQKGAPRVLRSAEVRPGGLREALQAGPFLVDHGKAVAGLNATKPAERTVLLADRKGATALLTTGPVTLAELACALATPGLFPGLEIDRALNLDGGSSTALWVATGEKPFSRPEWKQVRNAVAVVLSKQ